MPARRKKHSRATLNQEENLNEKIHFLRGAAMRSDLSINLLVQFVRYTVKIPGWNFNDRKMLEKFIDELFF